jgi:hypothetical protein
VDEADLPVTCRGIFAHLLLSPSPTSTNDHITHLGTLRSSRGMLASCTGKLVGFIYSFLLAYTNAKSMGYRLSQYDIFLNDNDYHLD